MGHWKAAAHDIPRPLDQLLHKADALLVYPKLTEILNKQRAALGLWPSSSSTGFLEAARSDTLHIMPTTPDFEFPRRNIPPSVRFVGPLLPIWDDDAWTPPPWWDELLRHPRASVVHVNQGTVATNTSSLIKPAMSALAAHKNLFVVVTSPDAETDLADVPTNT